LAESLSFGGIHKEVKGMKKTVVFLWFILILTGFINGDVAPDSDEIRVTADLTIETKEDLSDFRFFVDFSGAVHEIEIKSKSSTVISPLGGGARYSSGMLLAIPQKNLKDYPEKITSPYKEEGTGLSQVISQRKIEGIIELGRPQFSGIIKKSEQKNWSYSTYQIERDGNSIKLVKLNEITPKTISKGGNGGGIDFAIYGINQGLTPIGFLLMIATPLVIIGLVIWFLKKRKLKK
jgi:hypothetical protein